MSERTRFNDDMIQRRDLPQDVFELIHDLAYHIPVYGADYVRRAQKILMRKTFKMRVPLDLAKMMAAEDPDAAKEFLGGFALRPYHEFDKSFDDPGEREQRRLRGEFMYDPKCEQLARYFLEHEGDTPEQVTSLAQEIQESIEQWFEMLHSKPKDVTPLVHGVNCEKKPHVRTGYLHGEDDDTPYDVDGQKYCGRCHTSL